MYRKKQILVCEYIEKKKEIYDYAKTAIYAFNYEYVFYFLQKIKFITFSYKIK